MNLKQKAGQNLNFQYKYFEVILFQQVQTLFHLCRVFFFLVGLFIQRSLLSVQLCAAPLFSPLLKPFRHLARGSAGLVCGVLLNSGNRSGLLCGNDLSATVQFPFVNQFCTYVIYSSVFCHTFSLHIFVFISFHDPNNINVLIPYYQCVTSCPSFR